LKLVHQDETGAQTSVQAFREMTIAGPSGEPVRGNYIFVPMALMRQDTRATLLEQMRRDIQAFINKYEGLVEAAGLIRVLRDLARRAR
jgi:hypothetical protein